VLSRTLWPNLTEQERLGTSPKSNAYNCVAWAAGEDDRWWEPADPRYDPHIGPKHWPDGVPQRYTVENCVRVFVLLGYSACDGPEHEAGFEKIAIYADDDGEPTHVARQRPSGVWTSKVGNLEDTDHATVHSLEGGMYGVAVRFLRRPIP